MPDTALPSIFISYSREDSAFVDRLEADLRARGFLAWVDRRRLEGGQDWQREIDRAIEQHKVMVLVLSPNSTNSPAVTHEYQYATAHEKQVLPVLLQDCTPHYPISQQWIEDFLRRDYAIGLNALLAALLFQQLSLTAPSGELYERATALKGHSQVSDKEQAAVILRRILDRDPGYLQGLVQGDLDQLTESLYPSRAQNLRQQVITARKIGEYGVESSALEALLALGHPDPCAAEYLHLARQNSQFVDLYWVIEQQAAKGELNDARDKLQFLWSKAPYYRDPANVAPQLGLTLPRSYEEVQARKEAEEVRQQAEADADAKFYQDQEHHNAEAQPFEHWWDARSFAEAYRSQKGFLWTHSSHSEEGELMSSPNMWESTQTCMARASESLAAWRSIVSFEDMSRDGGLLSACAFLAAIMTVIALIGEALIQKIPGTVLIRQIAGGNPIARQLVSTGVGIVCFSLIIVFVLTFLLLLLGSMGYYLYAQVNYRRSETAFNHARETWRSKFQQWNYAQLQRLKHELVQRKDEAKAHYERRLTEIGTTYAHFTPREDPLLTCWQHARSV